MGVVVGVLVVVEVDVDEVDVVLDEECVDIGEVDDVVVSVGCVGVDVYYGDGVDGVG